MKQNCLKQKRTRTSPTVAKDNKKFKKHMQKRSLLHLQILGELEVGLLDD